MSNIWGIFGKAGPTDSFPAERFARLPIDSCQDFSNA